MSHLGIILFQEGLRYDLHLSVDLAVGLATGLLGYITYLLHKTEEARVTAVIIEGFQNEWHSSTMRLMQRDLFSEKFSKGFLNAVEAIYGKDTGYKSIWEDLEKLLGASPLASSTLEQFEQCLEEPEMIAKHPATGERFFTALQALDHVLIAFDRLALVRYKSPAADIVRQYKPPIEGLSNLLQAYISIRMRLQDPKRRNFKKEYMLLLDRLNLSNKKLLDECIEGLLSKDDFSLEDFSRKEREEINDFLGNRMQGAGAEDRIRYERLMAKVQPLW